MLIPEDYKNTDMQWKVDSPLLDCTLKRWQQEWILVHHSELVHFADLTTELLVHYKIEIGLENFGIITMQWASIFSKHSEGVGHCERDT